MRVEVIGASIAFDGEPVFTDLDATFRSGCVTALAGPSGSGKSSLLAAIAGHQQLAAGRIDVHHDDGRVGAPAPHLSVWVPQGSNALARRTVLDNVLIGPLGNGHSMRQARVLALDALEQVGLADRTLDQARRLSGGELQRVALARALASRRALILADEPSASLDAANTDLVASLLARVVTDATVIVATHDPLLMDAADAIVGLRRQVFEHG